MKRNFYEDNLEYIFDRPYEDNLQEAIEKIRNKNIKAQRVKSIFSGDMLESEAYPIWNPNPKGLQEKVKKGKTSKKQKELNEIATRKKVVRLVNGNFTDEDICVGGQYDDDKIPKSAKEAYKDVTNYLRRMKRKAEKLGIEFKYLYVTEWKVCENKKSKNYGKPKAHHHIIMNFPDRDIAEKEWKLCKYPNARRLIPDDYEFTGLAVYLSKDPKGKKSYGYSLNLHKSWIKPNVRVSNSKMSRRTAKNIAKENVDIREYYEKLYPGYEYIDHEVRQSAYGGGFYIYARLRKKKKANRRN